MATVYWTLYVSDSTVSSGSQGKTGLTLSVGVLKTTGASPGTDVSSHVAFTEIGGGQYQIAYDAETFGEAAGVIDCSTSLTVNSDRFLPVAFARDSGRIALGINANGLVAQNPATVLGSPRDVSAVADNAMTVNDSWWGSVVKAGGKEGPLSGTSFPVKTPAGTLYRTFAVDTATASNNPGASRA